MAHRAPARSSGLLSSIGVNLVSRRNGGRIGAYSPHCPRAGKSHGDDATICDKFSADRPIALRDQKVVRSEEHTSELQSLMRISYAVFCLKKKNNTIYNT